MPYSKSIANIFKGSYENHATQEISISKFPSHFLTKALIEPEQRIFQDIHYNVRTSDPKKNSSCQQKVVV